MSEQPPTAKKQRLIVNPYKKKIPVIPTPNPTKNRLEHVLVSLDTDQIKQSLKEALTNPEGLASLDQIFPASKFPLPSTEFCLRCKRNFDPNYYNSDLKCVRDHPGECIHRTYKDSKRSDYECERCGKEWQECWSGEGSSGGGCFVGRHTTDAKIVADEAWEEEAEEEEAKQDPSRMEQWLAKYKGL